MLTEYNGNIYNAEIDGDLVNIWKYVPVHGFEKKRTRRGITYYEKNVKLDEVSSFFTVEFEVYYDERKFKINSFEEDTLDLICDDELYANRNNFFEAEKGVWIASKSIKLFNEVYMLTHIENSNVTTVDQFPIDIFRQKWERYVKEVSI